MSASNIGITQLESLQLRNLVGPNGIGTTNFQMSGNTTGGEIVTNIPLHLLPDGTAQGTYISPFTVPSGTGIMRLRIQVGCSGGSALYYSVQANAPSGTGIPVAVPAATEGYAGWFYDGVMLYSNFSPSPASIVLTVGAQGSTQVANLLSFQVTSISFGPYVQQ